MDIHPGVAALVIGVFLLLIGAKFHLTGQASENVLGTYYLTDDGAGSLYVQLDKAVLRVAPTANEIDLDEADLNPRSQFAFFNNGDVLARQGDWETDLSHYMGMADVTPDDNVAAQTQVDEFVGERAASHSVHGNSIVRCTMNDMLCSNFHPAEHNYSTNYNVRINPKDDSVFITEGMAHKVSHYTAGGELISAYGVDLRFPKRVEIHPNGSLYFANTNKHRIERMGTRPEVLAGDSYQTFGTALAPLLVNSDVSLDSHYTWPLAVKYFAQQWWVINMDDDMRYGRLFHFADSGKFLGEWSLPENAEPTDLLVFNGELLISDAYSGIIHRVSGEGEALDALSHSAVTQQVALLTQKRESYQFLNDIVSWIIALIVLTLMALLLRGFTQRDNNVVNSDQSRPTFSILNSKEKPMLVSNIEILPNKRVVKHLGLVQGSTVRAKHAGKDIMASFKNLFGGELRAYTELLQESREEAVSRMCEQASTIGANAVINVRFSTSAIAAGASEILAYGTGVFVEDA